MNNENSRFTNRRMQRDGRVFTGALLLIAGSVLLASKMGFPVPHWLFSWEVILIAIGLLIGIKHRFSNPGWLIMIFIGATFLIADAYPNWNLRNYIWPIALMMLGLFFILKPKKIKADKFPHVDYNFPTPAGVSLDNSVDVTAVFSTVKRRILSKNFLGGDITAFMGGAEIDLTQADIQGTVVMDITAVFGAAKLVVPPDWDVQSHATAVFGGVEDKRYIHPVLQNNKVLVLDGVAVFGGIEINSYPSATQPV